ncbi:hypothetical protein [Halorubrum sp. HHNYT27]|uniref:hypothetical protein n=1 Tax=Halorubrum sp. HHNYT27 TaxID=3402275 RepID=UPI003EB9DB1F
MAALEAALAHLGMALPDGHLGTPPRSDEYAQCFESFKPGLGGCFTNVQPFDNGAQRVGLAVGEQVEHWQE